MTEHHLQKEIVQELRDAGILTYEGDAMSGLQFIPDNNWSNKKKRYAFINHHYSIGYTKGQPDLVLVLKDGETLFVELKNGKSGSQTLEQKVFQGECKRLSHNYVVWRSVQDAIDFIEGYKKL